MEAKIAKIESYRTCGNVGLNIFRENNDSTSYEAISKAMKGLSHVKYEAESIIAILGSEEPSSELLKRYDLQKYLKQVASIRKKQLEFLEKYPEPSLASSDSL